MVFQVVVNEDLSSVQVYRVNGGGNQLITIPLPDDGALYRHPL